METDLNTPEVVQLLKQSTKQALEEQNQNLGSEILRLTQILGMTI
jgi:hypothetical protein